MTTLGGFPCCSPSLCSILLSLCHLPHSGDDMKSGGIHVLEGWGLEGVLGSYLFASKAQQAGRLVRDEIWFEKNKNYSGLWTHMAATLTPRAYASTSPRWGHRPRIEILWVGFTARGCVRHEQIGRRWICAGGHLTMVVRGVHYGEENDDLTKRPHATTSQPSVWIGAGSWADDQK